MEKRACPYCNGEKIIVGTCECSSEWRHLENDNLFNDCICKPDIDCPECSGTGYVST